jgi:hypothetical protein
LLGEFPHKVFAGWAKINQGDTVKSQAKVDQYLVPTRDDIKGLERLSESKCNKKQNEDEPRTAPKEKQPDHSPDK